MEMENKPPKKRVYIVSKRSFFTSMIMGVTQRKIYLTHLGGTKITATNKPQGIHMIYIYIDDICPWSFGGFCIQLVVQWLHIYREKMHRVPRLTPIDKGYYPRYQQVGCLRLIAAMLVVVQKSGSTIERWISKARVWSLGVLLHTPKRRWIVQRRNVQLRETCLHVQHLHLLLLYNLTNS